MILILGILATEKADAATEMTAGVVLQRMETQERAAFMAGLVEGLAYARYVRDGKDRAGMACIKTWFYRTDGTLEQVYRAFREFADYPPAAVMAVLLDRACE